MQPGIIRSSLLSDIGGIVHAFTTREGGISIDSYASLNLGLSTGDDRAAVRANRNLVLEAIERPDARWVSLKQVHGVDIVQVTAQASRSIEADGLFTRDRDAAIAVMVADCVPIIAVDEHATVIAAVHAGWRGTEGRIAGKLVKRLESVGVTPASLRVVLGPAIGPESFEIGPEVAEALQSAFGKNTDAITPGRGDRYHADLWALNRSCLVASGVPEGSIETLRLDTYARDEFYSYRRDGAETGRHAAVIAFR